MTINRHQHEDTKYYVSYSVSMDGYSIIERGRINEFGERYAIDCGLSLDEAKENCAKLNAGEKVYGD